MGDFQNFSNKLFQPIKSSMSQYGLKEAKPDKPIRVAIVHYRDDATAGGSLRGGEAIANHVNAETIEAHLVLDYRELVPVAAIAPVLCRFIIARGPKAFPAGSPVRLMVGEIA